MSSAEYGERLLGGEMVPFCTDCGLFVADARTHDRFHSILGSHAWALAVLKTAHIAGRVHDRYEVVERIDSARSITGRRTPLPRWWLHFRLMRTLDGSSAVH